MNLTASQLRRMAADPAEYRRHLLIDVDGVPTPLAQAVDPFQRTDFEAMDPAWLSIAGVAGPEPQHRRAWIERHRGASKTQDAAASALWALAFSQRPVNGVCVAADQDQARILKQAIERLIRMNPWLGQVVESMKSKVVNARTGSELQVLASDERGSYGLLIDFAVLDEVSMWADDSMWSSLLSAVAKKRSALMVAIMNAGWRNSWCFKTRELVRQDPAWRFSHQTERATWITDAQIDEQRRLLPPAQYRRLWLNEWSQAEGDAFSEEQIRRLIVHEDRLWRRPPEYGGGAIGVDAGTERHHSALVVLLSNHTSGHIRVAAVEDFRPPVQLADLRDAILEARQMFSINALYVDPYQMIAIAQECEALGMNVIRVHPSGAGVQARMAVSLMEAVRNRTLELYTDPLLFEDLLGCQIVERPQGLKLELAENRHGHSDRLSALLQALPDGAEAAATPLQPAFSDGLGDNILTAMGIRL